MEESSINKMVFKIYERPMVERPIVIDIKCTGAEYYL